MPSIQLKALSGATPDGRELFQNLDLSFGYERTGIVGRNGTGKTTLLNLIAGGLIPSGGSVAVDGRIGVLRQTVQAGGGTVAAALGVGPQLALLDRIEAGDAKPDEVDAADWTLPTRIEQVLAEVGLGG